MFGQTMYLVIPAAAANGSYRNPLIEYFPGKVKPDTIIVRNGHIFL